MASGLLFPLGMALLRLAPPRRIRRVITVLFGLVVAGCDGSSAPPRNSASDPAGGSPPKPPSQALSRSLTEMLLRAARDYESYGRVDDQTRWAPFLCTPPQSGQARWSAPLDSAHGQKLYSLFARFRRDYVQEGPPIQPIGQVLVKESWTPKEVPQEEGEKALGKTSLGACRGLPWITYARHQGRVYRASEKVGLFIMIKTDGPEGETDRGWVYGTVSADGREVTSQGRIASCMSCHQKASGDRLFGVRPPE